MWSRTSPRPLTETCCEIPLDALDVRKAIDDVRPGRGMPAQRAGAAQRRFPFALESSAGGAVGPQPSVTAASRTRCTLRVGFPALPPPTATRTTAA